MKILWREKRIHFLAVLFAVGTTSLAGSLALASAFEVETLLGLLLWVFLGGPLVALLAIGIASKLAFNEDADSGPGRRRKNRYINPNTGEVTDNVIDASGYGRGWYP